MRMLIRLVVLGLAAYGAKTLYDKLAPRKEELRASGAQFLDRTTDAAREMGGKIGDATQSLVDTAQGRTAGVTATAAEQADEVRSAANEFASNATASPSRPQHDPSRPRT